MHNAFVQAAAIALLLCASSPVSGQLLIPAENVVADIAASVTDAAHAKAAVCEDPSAWRAYPEGFERDPYETEEQNQRLADAWLAAYISDRADLPRTFPIEIPDAVVAWDAETQTVLIAQLLEGLPGPVELDGGGTDTWPLNELTNGKARSDQGELGARVIGNAYLLLSVRLPLSSEEARRLDLAGEDTIRATILADLEITPAERPFYEIRSNRWGCGLVATAISVGERWSVILDGEVIASGSEAEP